MQARLTLHRFPTRMAAVLVVLIAALALAGFLGYTLKATTGAPGTTHTVVVPAQAAPGEGGGTVQRPGV